MASTIGDAKRLRGDLSRTDSVKVNGFVSNPRVTSAYLIPPLSGQTWTHEIGKSAILAVDKSDSTKENPFKSRYFYDQPRFTPALDIVHANAMIAQWYADRINTKFEELTQAEQDAVKKLTQLESPRATMREVLNWWNLIGTCDTEPSAAGTRRTDSERRVGALIRGLELIRHYWGDTIRGGDYGFLTLQMVRTTSSRVSFVMDNKKCFMTTEFKPQVADYYVPQFVAVADENKSLPFCKRLFTMDGRAYLAPEFMIGVCWTNPSFQYEYAEPGKPKFFPIIDRGLEHVLEENALTMNYLFLG